MVDFFQWWLSQLKTFLPQKLVQRWQHRRCHLNGHFTDKHLLLSLKHRGKETKPVSFSLPTEENLSSEAISFIDRSPQHFDQINITLDASHYLLQTIELPLAAEEGLTEAVSFQLNKLSPFESKNIDYFCGIKQRNIALKTLIAWVIIVPNKPINKFLMPLDNPQALPLANNQKDPKTGDYLTLSYRPDKKISTQLGSPRLQLISLGLLLLGLVFSLHIYNQNEIYNNLTTAITETKSKALTADDIRDKLSKNQMQIEQFNQLKSQSFSMMSIWKGLSEGIADHTWLQHLTIHKDNFSLQGSSTQASTLIESLESSAYFEKVRFTSSVTRDRQSLADRFSVSGKITTKADEVSP